MSDLALHCRLHCDRFRSSICLVELDKSHILKGLAEVMKFAEIINLERKDVIVFAQGKDLEGNARYAYIQVNRKGFTLMQGDHENRIARPYGEYGRILAIGVGQPNDEVREHMEKYYGVVL